MIISAFDRVESKQFLLFSQLFLKVSFPDLSKGVIVWVWVNSLPHKPNPKKKPFENIVGEGENAGD